MIFPQMAKKSLPGGGTTTLGCGTAISGGGTPDTGGGTPFRHVSAEFNHWVVATILMILMTKFRAVFKVGQKPDN